VGPAFHGRCDAPIPHRNDYSEACDDSPLTDETWCEVRSITTAISSALDKCQDVGDGDLTAISSTKRPVRKS
jgi:hypothetical protein